MARTLSNDLRKRVVTAVNGDMSRRVAAARYDVGEATTICWVARCRRTGSWERGKRGRREDRSLLDGFRSDILTLVEETADTTLNEIVDHLRDVHRVETSEISVERFFVRHGMTC